MVRPKAENLLANKRLDPATLCYGPSKKTVVVLGNWPSEESGKLWCACWQTGQRKDINPVDLSRLADTDQVGWEAVKTRVKSWARGGDHDAAWWLAYAYEGINQPSSVWYYIAALRISRGRPSWALQRVYSDTIFGAMCEGVDHPCIRFMDEIPEFNGAAQWGDWAEAIQRAEKAVPLLPTNEQYRQANEILDDPDRCLTKGIFLREFGVTEQGLYAWKRKYVSPEENVAGSH